MKKIILAILLLAGCTGHSRLYTSYHLKGVTNAAGGPQSSDSDLQLKKDRTFTKIVTIYGLSGNEMILLQRDSAQGTWELRQDTLYLRFKSPGSTKPNYSHSHLVRSRKLKRIYPTKVPSYKASGTVLEFDDN